jgi:hypothetical protein
MEATKVIALRDFALEHFPQGQKVRAQRHATQASYHYALYTAGALAPLSPTISAIEQVAVNLLLDALGLVMDWDEKLTAAQRHNLESLAVNTAKALCALTGTSLPWLDAVIVDEPPEAVEPAPAIPAPPSHSRPPALPPLQPGLYLSTKDAAAYLNRKVQTLHAWASQDSGPIAPKRGTGRLLTWHSDDVLRVLRGE